MKLQPKKNIVWFILLTMLLSCQTNKRTYTSKPSKSIVNPDSDLLEVNAVAHHINDSLTTVFLEVVNENLIYRRQDTSAAFYSELKVSYKLFSEQNSRKIIDSSSYYINDRAGESVSLKNLHSKFNVKARFGNSYYLNIEVLDINKRTKYNMGMNIYKLNYFSSQNYLVSSNNQIVFKNNFIQNQKLNISLSNTPLNKIRVEYFSKNFPLAAPPFSMKPADETKYIPDSIFTVELKENIFSLTMPVKGFYHIKANELNNEGLTLYTFDKTFPGVSDNDEMIDCTRYLMNKEEYDECKTASDKKNCIDNFWISIGGSNERARELLKKYYGRVKEANKYYTSYTQGWKTDRGMIFVVYGPPTNNYTSNNSEIWTYGSESNINHLRFVFKKTANPFSDNDFILERSQFFKEPWYMAVDYWRQGHVYLDYGR